MARLETLAPAKVNFGLRVVGRRDDGYHEIDSLFVPLALADEVSVEVLPGAAPNDAPSISLALETGDAPGAETVPADDSNLALRAAGAFLGDEPARAGVASVRIRLRKRIPAGAGLGGGSSDAGAVLRLLARLVPAGPQGDALATLALGLGADVPFFLAPRPARVRGIGERIDPVEGLPALAVVLANPGISLSTAAVYRDYDERGGGLTAPDPGPTMRALSGLGGDPSGLSGLSGFTNDLEAAAVRLCPQVARLRDRLREVGAVWAGMSGSGPTVYGVFPTRARAEAARDEAGFPTGTWTDVTRFQTGPAEVETPGGPAEKEEG